MDVGMCERAVTDYTVRWECLSRLTSLQICSIELPGMIKQWTIKVTIQYIQCMGRFLREIRRAVCLSLCPVCTPSMCRNYISPPPMHHVWWIPRCFTDNVAFAFLTNKASLYWITPLVHLGQCFSKSRSWSLGNHEQVGVQGGLQVIIENDHVRLLVYPK